MKLTPEQEGFLKYAEGAMLNTMLHPEFFIFYDKRTEAAWQAWTARSVWEPPNRSDYLPKFTESISEWELNNPNANWQVIFQTKEGLDWVRLTRAGDTPKQAVLIWASHFAVANDLAGGRLERW